MAPPITDAISAPVAETAKAIGAQPRYFTVALLIAVTTGAAIASMWDITKAAIAACSGG